MPAPLYVLVNTNAFTSTVFTLERPDQPVALQVGSLGRGNQITVEFSSNSGAAPFAPLQRTDGTGVIFTAHSGTGPAFCLLPRVPTPWGRIAMSSGPTEVTSLGLFTLTARG